MADQPVNLSPQTIRDLTESLRRVLNPTSNAAFGREAVTSERTGRSGLKDQTIEDLTQNMEELGDTIRKLNKLADKEERLGNEREAQRIRKLADKKKDQLRELQDHTEALKDGTETTRQSIKTRLREIDAMEEARKNLIDIAKSKIDTGGFMDGIRTVTDDYRKTLETGLDIDYFNNMFLGIGQQQSLALQQEYRRVANSLSREGTNFIDTINQIQNELYQYVGDAGEAAALAASLQQSARSIGLSSDVAQSFVQGTLMESFKQLNASLSMTSGQFSNLVESLAADQDIRLQLIRVQKDQRAGLMDGVLSMYKFYRQAGYASEQAEELAKQMTKQLGQQDPVERIRESARMRAMGGFLGLDPGDMARAQRIQMRGFDKSSQEDRDFYMNITEEMGRQYGQSMGGELGQQIGTYMAGARLGMTELLEQGADVSLTRQGLDQPQMKSSKERNQLLNQLLQVSDNINATIKSGVGQIVAAVIIGGAGRGLLGKINQSTGYKTSQSMKNVQGKMGGLLKGGKLGGIVGTGLGVAMAAGEGSLGFNKETAGLGGSLLGGAGAGALAGSMFGPIGTVIGGIAGAIAGEAFTEQAWDFFDDINRSEVEEAKEKTQNLEQQLLKQNQRYKQLNQLYLQTENENLKQYYKQQRDQLEESMTTLSQAATQSGVNAAYVKDLSRLSDLDQQLSRARGLKGRWAPKDISGQELNEVMRSLNVDLKGIEQRLMSITNSQGMADSEQSKRVGEILEAFSGTSNLQGRENIELTRRLIDLFEKQLAEQKKEREEKFKKDRGNPTSPGD